MKRKSLLFIAMMVVFATVINLFAGIVAFADGATENVLAGSGTSADPYLIEDKADLLTLEGQTLTASYKLTADIDLGGEDWTPITSFSGTFDGNGYTISGFRINIDATTRRQNVAFIGLLVSGGAVKNLTISNASVNVVDDAWHNDGTDVRDVAVLVANSGGTIMNCKLADDVTMTVGNIPKYTWRRLGGICGYAGGRIAYCENNATLQCIASAQSWQGASYKLSMGGIAGMSVSTIEYCVNNGDLYMDSKSGWAGYLGGILGRTANWTALATVSHCVNTGSVSSNNNCPTGGIIGAAADGGTVTLVSNYNVGTITLTNSDFVGGQILGFEGYASSGVSYLTGTNSNNGGVTDKGDLISFATGGYSKANIGSTDTEENLKAQATYKSIVAEVAEHLTGISTDLYGYQTKAVEDGKFDLRLVATLSGDYTTLANVGFAVSVSYNLDGAQVKEANKTVTKLYNSITATDAGVETAAEHTATSLGGDYIFVLACKGLPANATDITFTVTTFYTATGEQTPVNSEMETFVITVPNDTLPTV